MLLGDPSWGSSDLPAFSYSTGVISSLGKSYLYQGNTQQSQDMQALQRQLSQLDTTLYNTQKPSEETPMVTTTPTPQLRLISYIVVDPDKTLAEKNPGACILTRDMRLLYNIDDQGFVLDLASELLERLASHNTLREGTSYEVRENGMEVTRKLKPIKLSQLEIAIIAHKTWA